MTNVYLIASLQRLVAEFVYFVPKKKTTSNSIFVITPCLLCLGLIESQLNKTSMGQQFDDINLKLGTIFLPCHLCRVWFKKMGMKHASTVVQSWVELSMLLICCLQNKEVYQRIVVFSNIIKRVSIYFKNKVLCFSLTSVIVDIS